MRRFDRPRARSWSSSRGPGLIDPDLIDATRMAEVLGQAAEEASGARLDRSRLTGRATRSTASCGPIRTCRTAQRLVQLTGRYHLAAGEDRWGDKLAAFLSRAIVATV